MLRAIRAHRSDRALNRGETRVAVDMEGGPAGLRDPRPPPGAAGTSQEAAQSLPTAPSGRRRSLDWRPSKPQQLHHPDLPKKVSVVAGDSPIQHSAVRERAAKAAAFVFRSCDATRSNTLLRWEFATAIEMSASRLPCCGTHASLCRGCPAPPALRALLPSFAYLFHSLAHCCPRNHDPLFILHTLRLLPHILSHAHSFTCTCAPPAPPPPPASIGIVFPPALPRCS